jgi:hypothetical protein
MAAQFAGSRSLDERRRRRLATESDEAAPEPVAAPSPRRASALKPPAKLRGPSHLPLRKVISTRLWKHAGLALLGLLVAAGILAGGWAAETHPARLGPGLVRLFDLSAARLVHWYISTAIFLASQLALLVWWLRSQSLQDFNGRYRGWACCAMLGFLAAFAVQTEAFRAWSQTVDWLWHFDVRHKQALCWIAPVLVCGLPAWRFLHREMRDCRLSLALLWLAVLLGGGLGVLAVSGPLPLPAVSARFVQCGIAMLAAQCLFLSFLFHARHAIYISVEPPAERPAWFIALWRRYRGAGERSRSRKAATGSPKSAVTASGSRRKRTSRPARSADSPIKEVDVRTDEPPAPAVSTSKPQTRVDQRHLRRSA